MSEVQQISEHWEQFISEDKDHDLYTAMYKSEFVCVCVCVCVCVVGDQNKLCWCDTHVVLRFRTHNIHV